MSADSTPSGAAPRGRFEPGAMVGGRYRIIGPLGRGGMGEVFRADDLKLGQPVALKFLPVALSGDPGRLARFHTEVRLARQVSHPNVCRVYDIGEAAGEHYISMEYVDGEDLSSLLRRIGRLPGDKAVEIARQLCAGLAAAHERGVLHRDLKPANVMIDGQGKVRITDFGLAGLAADLKGATAREGTPYYMAPEQLAGKGVTRRSDIYSLGLVLYEMLTGRPPFKADTPAEMSRLRDESTPATPSSIVSDLDPALERVILRCLDRDPAGRPASALAVAAALPGADPLAAALAAGETPSPEMVAAAGDVGGIRPGWGTAFLVMTVAGLMILAGLGQKIYLPGRVPLDNPPQVLAARAREIAGRLGYKGPAADSASDFFSDAEALFYIDSNDQSPDRWDRLAGGRPAMMQFWYRQSPRALEPTDYFGHVLGTVIVQPDDPPADISGMLEIRLDTQGRLLQMSAVPPQVDKVEDSLPEFGWETLFAESGLDASLFKPAPSEWLPAVFSDARGAWVKSDAARVDLPDRVEAAAYRGRPVYFQMIWPWTRPARMRPFEQSRAQQATQGILLAIFVAVLAGGALVARHNLRLGRGDRRGAMRLAVSMMVVLMAVWVLRASHVLAFYELGIFIMGASGALFGAGLVWLLYVALEPYVRKRWPVILISWSRLLAGRLRDPLVGRDLLLGSVLGVAVQAFVMLVRYMIYWLGLNPLAPTVTSTSALMGMRRLAADVLLRLPLYLFAALAVLFLLFLLRLIVRKGWLAGSVFVLIFAVAGGAGSTLPLVSLIVSAVLWSAMLLILTRLGLLAFVTFFYVLSLVQSFLLTLDPSVWYAGSTWFAIAVVLALAGYGFKVALAGRPVFGAAILEE